MASSSSIPAVIDALVARATVVHAGTDAQILDGGPTTQTDQNLVCIGYNPNPGEPAVNDTRSPGGIAAEPNRESYDVQCVASSWLGEQHDPKTVRDRAFELVDALAADLARDQTLGGIVMAARLFTVALIPEQTTKGAVATVRFVVHIDAFTR